MEALVSSLRAVERRRYEPGDVTTFRLVVTATGIPDVDGAVFSDADAAGVWVNSADDPAHCSFILPALHRDGQLTVAVSTGGLSPALSSWLRTRLAAECGDGLGALAELLAEARASSKTPGGEAIRWTGSRCSMVRCPSSYARETSTRHVRSSPWPPSRRVRSPFRTPSSRRC